MRALSLYTVHASRLRAARALLRRWANRSYR